jgi:hypothetical protein
MLRGNERGEGKMGTIFGLLLLAGVLFAVFHVGPVFWDHFQLVDKMNELARAPRWNHPDDRIYELLQKYVREERLDAWVGRNSFTISTVETGRRISVVYHRQTEILPGVKYDFQFNKQVDQPLVY